MDRYFAFCQGDLLLTADGRIPQGPEPVALKPWQRVTLLRQGPDSLHVIRLDGPVASEGLQMMNLRKTSEILSPEDYQLAGKCAELIYWDQQTHHCGVCGAPLQWQTEISKRCPQCGKEWWPSPAVAVIVRITRADEVLLVSSRNFRGTFYGLVAGFVETGETLEEAVRREVLEETGLTVADLRYWGSQPWPYPCGLMVAFTAHYAGGRLRLQRQELAAGGWFRRDAMPQLPAKPSIARALVEEWMAAKDE